MPYLRRLLALVLALALAGQQAFAFASAPCAHHAAATSAEMDHGDHGMHHAAAADAASPDGGCCECSCATTQCLKAAAIALPVDLHTVAARIDAADPPRHAIDLELGRGPARLLRPPIAA